MPEPLTIQFATLEDRQRFSRFIKTAQESEGTPPVLPVSLACIALKAARLDDPTEEEERKRGEILVSVLNLKPIKPAEPGSDCPRYRTEWGSKTALGLFRTLRGIIDGELPR